MAISTVIASATRVNRESLAFALEREGRVKVIATVNSAEEALRVTRELDPSVVLLDLGLRHGTVAAHWLRSSESQVKIVALGVQENERDILAWAESGVVGCLLSEASLEEVVNTIEKAHQGRTSCSPEVATVLFRRFAALVAVQNSVDVPAAPNLTKREREIVKLLGEELSNKEIARILSIEVSTVKNHLRGIFTKLHVSTRGEAAGWADRYRISVLSHAGHVRSTGARVGKHELIDRLS